MPLLPLFSAFLIYGSSLQLAKLSDSGSCRALYNDEATQTRVCVTRAPWEEWLTTQDPPQLPILTHYGKWRVFSPLENTPVQSYETNPPAPRKTEMTTQKLEKWEPSRAPPPLWLRLKQAIERKREALSQALKPYDQTGTLRSILLSENTQNDLGLLRTLGFVHFAATNGLHLYFLALAIAWIVMHLTPQERFVPAGKTFAHALAAGVWVWSWCLAGAQPRMIIPCVLWGARAAANRMGLRWNPAVLIMIALAAAFALTGKAWAGAIYLFALSGSLLARALSVWSLLSLRQVFAQGYLNTITPLLSLVLLPLIAGVIYPGLILLSFFPASWLFSAVHGISPLIHLWNSLLLAMVDWDLRIAAVWVIPHSALLLGAWLSLLLLRIRGRLVYVSLILLLSISLRLATAAFVSDSNVRIEQLDVGQGDAALVTGASSVGLIDTGSVDALSPEAWIALLAERGLNHLDWIALTHLDADHAGGARTLAETLPVGCIETSHAELASPRGQDLLNFMSEKKIAVQDWGGDCVPFPTFGPSPGSKGANANMGAVLVPFGPRDEHHWFLSMGDAEGEDELRLAKKARAKMGGSAKLVLKISHHGSRTSSAENMLEILKPKIAIISDGIGNTYGHPSEEVLNRLSADGIPTYRTDQLGSIDAEAALTAAGDRRPPRTHRP